MKVEHVNAQFKGGLMHLCGNYTEAALQRVAKSMDISNQLREKLYPQYVDRYPVAHGAIQCIILFLLSVKIVVLLNAMVTV